MLFKFKAVTPEGSIKEGTLEAESKWEVIDRLEVQELIPLEVKEHREKNYVFTRFLSKLFKSLRKKASKKDVLVFTNSLQVLLKSGLPLDKALSISREVVSSEIMRDIIDDLISEVRQGTSLSDALSKYPRYFPSLYVNMVKAGEAGGVLPEVLERLSEYLSKVEEFRNTLLSSITYPLILILVGLGSIFVLTVFVVPRFSAIFESLNMKPPVIIKILSAIGSFFSEYFVFFGGALFVLFIFLSKKFKTGEGRGRLYRLLMKMPFVGSILVKIESSRFSRNLGMLLLNGVPILQSILITKELFANPTYRNEMDRIYEAVKKGEKLSNLMTERKFLWHPVLLGMVEVGEEAGTLDSMLIKAAESLEKDVEDSVKSALSLVEPVTILFMGLVVGSIVVSMLSAIFSVNNIVF